MITFIIKLLNKELADRSEFDQIHHALVIEFRKIKFLSPYHKGYSVGATSESILICFNGIQPDPIANYLIGELNVILSEMGLRELYRALGVDVVCNACDTVINIDDFKPSATRNALLMANHVNDDEIPSEYLCSMSHQIMNDPAFTIMRPDNKSKLFKGGL